MTTTKAAVRWDPDALAALEYERETILRELRELDDQRATAEIDEDQYVLLRDELTARTADVLTSIRRGTAAKPLRAHRPRTAAVAAAATACVVGVAGWLLVSQLAPRVAPAPPQAAAATATSRVARLAATVQEKPGDIPARVALARLLIQEQDLPAALAQFDAVVEIDQGHAEALAYGGWVSILTGDTNGGLDRLGRAVAAHPDYPDAHALRGLALMRSGDTNGAVDELRRYLSLAPNGPLAEQVSSVIARLGAAP
jgi:tetratricopeptide (TPR) repeat protein